MNFHFAQAKETQAAQIAALHMLAADNLTAAHGPGPWASKVTEKGVLYAMRHSRVFVGSLDQEIIATLCLTTKKPWAIDPSYFTSVKRPLYLIAMAVTPARQRQGFGKLCLDLAAQIARKWPADCIRLDAYDAVAGAGKFYAKCGFTEVGRASYRNVPLIYYQLLL